MDRDGCLLIIGDDPGVPERLRAMVNRRFRKVETNGDGACAIHALAGIDHSGVPRHADASCDERSASLQRRCVESASICQH